MAHNQSYVTVMLNKRHYSNNIAVFDMFTVILPNTFNFFSGPRKTTSTSTDNKECLKLAGCSAHINNNVTKDNPYI